MNTVINVRTNKETRDKAKKVFSGMGMSTSAGINMFLARVVLERGLPFSPTLDARKIREHWDKQAKVAALGKKYNSARSALRGL